ncbi:MAG TPA: glycosyltransferase family 2 protein [Fimbriimonas sp.]|nr:glycosyltransferase family 2 protein [Fimbriimonas sp.]
MKLSVVIVNWNTRDLLEKCLGTLAENVCSWPFEVIVVDNQSKDGSASMVQAQFPHFTCIESGGNLGYAAGNNLGIEHSQGEYILTLNSDTELAPNVLESAVNKLESMPKHGAMGVKQIGVDGNVQHSVRGFPSLLGVFGDVTKLGKLIPALDSYRQRNFDYSKSQDADQPMGTFLLLRRSALDDIAINGKPFDLDFPIFFNEVDLLYRLRKKGWLCHYTADIEILHHGGESTKQVRKNMIWESHKSLVRYFSKHLTGMARISLPLVAGIIYLAALVRARGYHAGFRP